MILGYVDLLEVGVVSLGQVGSIEWVEDRKEIRLRTPIGDRSYSVSELVGNASGILYCMLPKGPALLLGDHSGETIACINLESFAVESSRLSRTKEQDSSFNESQFMKSPYGPLFIYEHGLLAFSLTGKVRWSVDGHKLDHHFMGIVEDWILYESEFSGKWRYNLSNGNKVVE